MYRNLLSIPLAIAWSKNRRLECSPTYNGVPVAAPFLMTQAVPIFEAKFPGKSISNNQFGLEMSPVFVTDHPEFSYKELGLFASLYPTSCRVEIPVFEKLPEKEEERLGNAGIRKHAVGKLVLVGSCKFGCATVLIKKVALLKPDDSLVWQWEKQA